MKAGRKVSSFREWSPPRGKFCQSIRRKAAALSASINALSADTNIGAITPACRIKFCVYQRAAVFPTRIDETF